MNYSYVCLSHGYYLCINGSNFLLVAESTVVIFHGPQNEKAEEGGLASFPCFYSGTNEIPIWFIDKASYSVQMLPARHSYFNQTLTIYDIQASDNGTTYTCAFLRGPRSFTATLTVVITGSHFYQRNFILII